MKHCEAEQNAPPARGHEAVRPNTRATFWPRRVSAETLGLPRRDVGTYISRSDSEGRSAQLAQSRINSSNCALRP